jgi:hypothetical protein
MDVKSSHQTELNIFSAAKQALLDGADAPQLTHLVDGRPDLVDRLTQAWLAGNSRMLSRAQNFRHAR